MLSGSEFESCPAGEGFREEVGMILDGWAGD